MYKLRIVCCDRTVADTIFCLGIFGSNNLTHYKN
jgi:hypothetical protein